MDVRTLQALLLSGKWRLVPYEAHDAGMAGSTTLAGGENAGWTDGGQLTANEPETVENTRENSTVFRVSNLGDVTGPCGGGHGHSETENETAALELCHIVGWGLDTCSDDDERG